VRRAVLAIGALVGAVVICVGAIDLLTFQDDEVITLVTFAANGDAHETPLWIVEIPADDRVVGELWVRARSSNAEWLARLVASPEVEVRREDGSGAFVAESFEEDVALRGRVNTAMSEKYGAADRMTSWFADPASSVPVRLRPVAAKDEPTAPGSSDR